MPTSAPPSVPTELDRRVWPGVDYFELGVLAAELSRLVAQHQARAFSEDELRGCLRQLEDDNRLMFRGERIDVWD